jgi:hypothetical protein
VGTSEQAARGLKEIEDYLYRESHLAAAYQRVTALTEHMRDLTQGQKAAVERWYLDEQRHVAYMVTEHIAELVDEMKGRHRVRLRRWIVGMLGVSVLVVAGAVGVCVAVLR